VTAEYPAPDPTVGGSFNKRVKLSTKNMLSGELAAENSQPARSRDLAVLLGHLHTIRHTLGVAVTKYLHLPCAALFIQ